MPTKDGFKMPIQKPIESVKQPNTSQETHKNKEEPFTLAQLLIAVVRLGLPLLTAVDADFCAISSQAS